LLRVNELTLILQSAKYYRDTIASKVQEEKFVFFDKIKQIFDQDVKTATYGPSDILLNTCFEHTTDSGKFIEMYLAKRGKTYSPEKASGFFIAQDFKLPFKGTEEQYFIARERLAGASLAWTPDLLDPDELVIAYDLRFQFIKDSISYTASFAEFIGLLRTVYEMEAYDVTAADKGRVSYTAAQIAAELKRIVPGIVPETEIPAGQVYAIKYAIEKPGNFSLKNLLKGEKRGTITDLERLYRIFGDSMSGGLKSQLDSDPSKRAQLQNFLARNEDDPELELLYQTFGNPAMTQEQKTELAATFEMLRQRSVKLGKS